MRNGAREALLQKADPGRGARSRSLVERLRRTNLYREYEAAFRSATGLPLALRPVEACEEEAIAWIKEGNPFCGLMAETAGGCAGCLRLREELEERAWVAPKSLQCFAGLWDTAVPLRVNGRRIALIHTGQILLREPRETEFNQTVRQLYARNGADRNGAGHEEALRKAYFLTRVLDREQYDGMVRLLATFAEHLALACADLVEEEERAEEPRLVREAKKHIGEHFRERISLDEAAAAVHASTRHFCKVFKAATGMTFTDYLARVRVEKAKGLLRNPHLRVSEIAFETGFESISQFNRSFKRITGFSPTCFRAASEAGARIDRPANAAARAEAKWEKGVFRADLAG